jgi:hypothetical protein
MLNESLRIIINQSFFQVITGEVKPQITQKTQILFMSLQ